MAPAGTPRLVVGPRGGFAELSWPNGALRRIESPGVADAKRDLNKILAWNRMRATEMAGWTRSQLANRREVEHQARRRLDQAVQECLISWGVVPARAGGYVVDEEHWQDRTAVA